MILKVIGLVPLLLLFISIPIVVFLESRFNYYWDFVAFNIGGDGYTHELYDFIVVGSGSAGAVVANRLSKHNKVLLIEAGGEPLTHNYIPGLALGMLHRSEVDWMHETVPQKHSMLSQTGRINHWPRGKLLGGTSNLNYMLYVRGSPYDYDNWANITGDDNWNYENVLPFFKKSLDYHGVYESEEHYGKTPYGTVHVEKRDWAPMRDTFIEAAEEAGYPRGDINSPHKTGIWFCVAELDINIWEGVGPYEVFQKNGKRFGTYMAFLKGILHRTTLKISKFSQAIKIKLDSKNQAEGVWYTRHGRTLFARATKEVVVSGGAIDSPKLLMLSGIGPKEDLKSLGIKSRADLPVGKNLRDHLAVLLTPFLMDKPVGIIPERDFGIATITDYVFRGKGPLTCPGGFHTNLFMCTSTSKCKKTGKDWPDMQLYFSPVGLYNGVAEEFTNGFGFKSEDYFSKFKVDNSFMIAVTMLLPKAVGDIKLRDKNPMSKLLIDPRYLDHPDDLQVMIEGIKESIRIVEETKAFKSINARFANVPIPGCENHVMRSNVYWECLIRHWGMTLYHPVGTCSMGRGPNDPNAVLDSQLRVLKTKGLRVADASIMPDIVAGNTNAPCIMIGEKASDIIRDFWSKQFLVCDKQAQLLDASAHIKCYYSKFS